MEIRYDYRIIQEVWPGQSMSVTPAGVFEIPLNTSFYNKRIIFRKANKNSPGGFKPSHVESFLFLLKRWSNGEDIGLKSPQLHIETPPSLLLFFPLKHGKRPLHHMCHYVVSFQEFCWALLWNYHGLKVVNWMLRQRWMTNSWRRPSCERWVAGIWSLTVQHMISTAGICPTNIGTKKMNPYWKMYISFFNHKWFWYVFNICVPWCFLLEHFLRCVSGRPVSYVSMSILDYFSTTLLTFISIIISMFASAVLCDEQMSSLDDRFPY